MKRTVTQDAAVKIAVLVVMSATGIVIAGNLYKNRERHKALSDLKYLQSIAEKYESDNSHRLPETVIRNTDSPRPSDFTDRIGAFTRLYRYTPTRDMLLKLGERVKQSDDKTPVVYVLDQWGHPISFFEQTTSAKMHFRSSGPDGKSNLSNPTDAVNNDDILSCE